MADENSQRTLEGPMADNAVDLGGWSTLAEDLLDGGDEDGAVKLLEDVVQRLQIRSDAEYNLGLAAALNDLGTIYATQGLSDKSDEVLNAALVIKERARGPSGVQSDVWVNGINDFCNKGLENMQGPASEPASNARDSLNEIVEFQNTRNTSAGPSIADVRDEDDWEAVVDKLPTLGKSSSPAIQAEVIHCDKKSTSKQWGRGSFTYGGKGMYSDNLDMSSEEDIEGGGSSQWDYLLDGGSSHVLVLSFPPKTKTKDLEDLVKPFSTKGSCSVRWMEDTKALAVFSSPTMARDAFVGIKDERYKVSMFFESNDMHGVTSVKDLEPPAPRPASTARVAQRMIARALNSQGVSQALLSKSRVSTCETQEQERQRKERLHSRAQLRNEAWGSDDE